MIWMALIMTAPLWGMSLFLWLSSQAAGTVYGILVGVSLFYDWLMMGAMHLPVRSGKRGMIGTTARVLNWRKNVGTVLCAGEIWKAKSIENQPLQANERVEVKGVSSMILVVKPARKRAPTLIE